MGAAAAVRVWVAPSSCEDAYCVAVLTDDAFYAAPPPPDNPNIPARLAAGETPEKTLGEKARRVALSALSAVTMNRAGHELSVLFQGPDTPEEVGVEFVDAGQLEEAFAALRERLGTGWTHATPRLSVWKALGRPVQFLLLSAGVPLIMVAVGLLGGDMAGKQSWGDFLVTVYAVVMIVLAVLGWIYLGPAWVLGIAGALLLVWLAWAVVCVARRPMVEQLTRT
jgi:hypothetical protein